jgi:hypothetical protein
MRSYRSNDADGIWSKLKRDQTTPWMSSSSSARDPRSTSILCRSKAVNGVGRFVVIVDQMTKWRG